jgi:hypothetical protein
MSAPVVPNGQFRESFEVKYEPRLTMRFSDVSQLPHIIPRPKELPTEQEISVLEG